MRVASPLQTLLFANFEDQRVYALDVDLRTGPTGKPRPLTPMGPGVASAHGASLRFADPTPVSLVEGTREVWWVCEDHSRAEERGDQGDPLIQRSVVAVPLDGSAEVRRVTPVSRFIAHPRLSPDGTHLAWITWRHPQMPWDGTGLHVGRVGHGAVAGNEGTAGDVPAGDVTVGHGAVAGSGVTAGVGTAEWGPVVTEQQVCDGSTDVSVLQPEWLDSLRLIYLSDRSGFWTPQEWSLVASASDAARPAQSRPTLRAAARPARPRPTLRAAARPAQPRPTLRAAARPAQPRPILPADAPQNRIEWAGPLWSIGTTWLTVLDSDHVLARCGRDPSAQHPRAPLLPHRRPATLRTPHAAGAHRPAAGRR